MVIVVCLQGNSYYFNLIGDVMDSMFTSSMVDHGVQTKTIKLVFLYISAKHAALIRAKTDWFGIRIMCQSRATSLPSDYCFSELAQ